MELQTIFEPIRADLDQVEQILAGASDTEVPELGGAIMSLVQAGGKRIRAALAIFASKFHPAESEAVHRLAVAIELLHAATLIHDDLIDSASLRRGAETLNARWSGTATVLAGDYLLAKAGYVAADVGNLEVFKIISQAVMTLCEGEIRQDFDLSGLPDRERYFEHIYSKTAALFAASTECGAILSGANASEIGALRAYGRQLGLAFQIVDDTLDFVGAEAEIGKPVGSDLREGIYTLPAIWFLERDPRAAEARRWLFENGREPHHQEEVIEMIRTSPAIEAAREQARVLARGAQEALLSLPDNRYRQSMADLADFTVARTR